MRPLIKSPLLVACFLCSIAVVTAQQTQSTSTLTAVPKLVRFTGSFHPSASQPAGTVGATFAIYGQQEGGAPLWTEDQNVELDVSGNYTVLLGSTKNEGVPPELFAGGEARWLQVELYVPGEVDAPRVLLVSVPYALKAADADTLGGKPASSYLLAGSSTLAPPAQSVNSVSAMAATVVEPATTTINSIARFTSTAGTVGNSAIYQNGSNIGVGTATPAAKLEVDGNVQVDGSSIFASGSVPLIQFPAGSNNFSAGLDALPPVATGTANTAVGDSALKSNTTGYNNTATGTAALQSNTTGCCNEAVGLNALLSNTAGSFNVAIGNSTLVFNTTGISNTASGTTALKQNTTGNNNTADGNAALYYNTTGGSNIAVGFGAGLNITTTSNNIDIGNPGTATDSGAIRIGTAGTQTTAFIAGIYGVTTSASNAVPVLIDSNGNLGTISSSRRYKEDIQDMGDASSGLMRLRPVTFRYKKPYNDGSQPIQYGLIAEEVAEVYPDLVARSADGQIETVKYQVLDPMLLNELQKQKEQIRSLEERLAKLEAGLAGTTVTASSR